MSISRLLTNIYSDRLTESRDFYVTLLGVEVAYESDWYIQLRSPVNPGLEFGIMLRSHDLVPPEYQTAPAGVHLTFVVPDVDLVYEKAIDHGFPIIQAPKNEFYGQRRFLTIDPNGCLIDISSPVSD
jgi:catechol 2,3-dioxygenase-like lactoylglutathione lyase family enzyme